MIRNLIFSFLLVITLISCDKLYVLNDILIYKDTFITQNDSTTLSFEKIMNGDYSYRIKEDIVKRGTYRDSKPVGEWDYYLIGESSRVDTSIYWKENNQGTYSIHYPSTWKHIERKDSTFKYIFDLAPNIEKTVLRNNYFIISRHYGDETLEEYNSNYNNVVKSDYKVEWMDNFDVTLNGNLIGYFNRYLLINNEEKRFVLNYNLMNDNAVYDITMKVNDIDNKSIPHLLFFETLRTYYINSEPILKRQGILKIESK